MVQRVAIVGAGPAGLMAAQQLSKRPNFEVTVYEAMAMAGRKFLLAGRSGLNLTNTLPLASFIGNYQQGDRLAPFIEAYPCGAVIDWAMDLGIEVFEGSSGLVFPKSMRATSLLRAWLSRLETSGVKRERAKLVDLSQVGDKIEIGLVDGTENLLRNNYDAIVLALGGKSWPGLGSNGCWVDILENKGILVSPFESSNAGVQIDWDPRFVADFHGSVIKNVKVSCGDKTTTGDITITKLGMVGSPIYRLNPNLRAGLSQGKPVSIELSLLDGLGTDDIEKKLSSPKASLSTLLARLKVGPAATALVHRNLVGKRDPAAIARALKSMELSVTSLYPIERAISSAGGVSFEELDGNLMLKKVPNVYCIGEMVDWDAPTGGYLLQACFSMGHWVAEAIAAKGSAQ